MKNKHVVLIAGVAAGLVVAAPTAMAVELPGLPGAEPNGGVCTFEPGAAEASSDTPAITPPHLPGLPDTNAGNCESFLNDEGNGVGSGKTITFPPELPHGSPTAQ